MNERTDGRKHQTLTHEREKRREVGGGREGERERERERERRRVGIECEQAASSDCTIAPPRGAPAVVIRKLGIHTCSEHVSSTQRRQVHTTRLVRGGEEGRKQRARDA